MTKYKFIDHTADVGIQVFGDDPQQLFTNAGIAMFELITDLKSPKWDHEQMLSIKGEDWPDLLVAWLRELLYLWTGKELLVTSIEIEDINEFSISAYVRCVDYNAEKHRINHEIKAVTYHQIEVKKTHKDWTATVIFDI